MPLAVMLAEAVLHSVMHKRGMYGSVDAYNIFLRA